MKDNDYWHRRNEEKMYKQFTMELAGRTLRVDIGRVCAQANGAALMHYGDTVVLSTYQLMVPGNSVCISTVTTLL